MKRRGKMTESETVNLGKNTASTKENKETRFVRLVYRGKKALLRDFLLIAGLECVVLNHGSVIEVDSGNADLILKKSKSFEKL